MRRFFVFACAACLHATPAAAQSQLVDQQVMGAKRICIYEDTRPTVTVLGEPRRSSVEIGRGEPCPYRYSQPGPERRTRRATPLIGDLARPRTPERN